MLYYTLITSIIIQVCDIVTTFNIPVGFLQLCGKPEIVVVPISCLKKKMLKKTQLEKTFNGILR